LEAAGGAADLAWAGNEPVGGLVVGAPITGGPRWLLEAAVDWVLEADGWAAAAGPTPCDGLAVRPGVAPGGGARAGFCAGAVAGTTGAEGEETVTCRAGGAVGRGLGGGGLVTATATEGTGKGAETFVGGLDGAPACFWAGLGGEVTSLAAEVRAAGAGGAGTGAAGAGGGGVAWAAGASATFTIAGATAGWSTLTAGASA
jgi:hypothetical protein